MAEAFVVTHELDKKFLGVCSSDPTSDSLAAENSAIAGGDGLDIDVLKRQCVVSSIVDQMRQHRASVNADNFASGALPSYGPACLR